LSSLRQEIVLVFVEVFLYQPFSYMRTQSVLISAISVYKNSHSVLDLLKMPFQERFLFLFEKSL